MKFKHLITLFIACIFALSCGKSNNPDNGGGGKSPDKEFTVRPTSLSFEDSGGTETIKIKASKTFDFTLSKESNSWCHVTKNNKGLNVTADINDSNDPRKAIITIHCVGFADKTVEVLQLGWEKVIVLSTRAITVSDSGGTEEFTVTSNCGYNIDIKYDNDKDTGWLKLMPKTKGNHESISSVEKLIVELNSNKEKRYGNLVITPSSSKTKSLTETKTSSEIQTNDSQDNNIRVLSIDEIPLLTTKSNITEVKEVKREIRITQEAYGNYKPGNEIDIKDDEKIKVKGGRASSAQGGEGIEKSFDGDMNTLWHSAWNNSGTEYFPITIEYDFKEGTQIDYFVYHPRTSGNNGRFKEVEISVKCRNGNQAGDFVKLFDFDFKGAAVATKVEIHDALAKLGLNDVETIKMQINSGAGDGQGFASCAEMEFYKYAEGNFEPESLFKDSSCSELKDGITKEDIMKCKSPFFKRIALYMFNNDYPREYRIAEYQAYPNPNVMSRKNKTNQYGFLDNVTGIYVNRGEELVVLTGPLHGRNVTLCIQNLDKPGGDGFWQQQNFPLNEGINKFKTTDKGLCYIIYQPEDYEVAPDIKVHFATGHINGYFDIRTQTKGDKKGEPRHSDDEWSKIINNAGFKYFDIIADKVHLTFPTEKFKNVTKNGGALGRAWNTIVENEWELMGLYKHPERQFKHRMHCIVMYRSFMYATSFYTAYNESTLGDIANEEKLITSACWGPAHEIGHVNQTRPGFLWTGTTEVTNNVMSEYIQTAVFKQKSRLQKESMGGEGGFSNRYAKAWYSAMVRKDPHCDLGYESDRTKHDVFCKLVPFWQLQLYMGEVLKESPMYNKDKDGFYPRLYELVRTEPNQPNPGMQQTEFVILACKAAKLNLLDFFTKWGFLTPVDEEVDDYQKAQLTVTEERAKEVKQAVEALGYSKPDGPVHYITDLNKDYFISKAKIVKGTATRNQDVLKMKNWKNVVVYEVRDAKDNLIHVDEGKLDDGEIASFKVKKGWRDDYKVYAISATGEKVLVEF